jgi:chemosensory pili system protein ChpA (sensor histidine kinase/response regulator)
MADLPDYVALRSVVTAMREELLRIKQRLELFGQGDRQRLDDVASLLPSLRQVADTLAVLGFGQPRKVIIDQVAVLQGLVQGLRMPEDALLLDVAGALLYVESTLSGRIGSLEPDGTQVQPDSTTEPVLELGQIRRLVIGEARACLHKFLLEVDDLGSHPGIEGWQPAREWLVQVRGALAMLSLDRAARLVQACLAWIESARPGSSTEALGETVTRLDEYLQQREQAPESASENLLEWAERPLKRAPAQKASGVDPAHSEATWTEPAGDSALLEIFHGEALVHLASLEAYLASAPAPEHGLAVSEELMRALHTLKGSARVAEVHAVAELADAMDLLVREYKTRQWPLQVEELRLLASTVSLLHGWLEPQADTLGLPLADSQGLILAIRARLAERLRQPPPSSPQAVMTQHDPEATGRFLEHGMDILMEAESVLQHWRQHPAERQGLDTLLDQLTVLGQNAAVAEWQPVDELCEALLDLYGAVEESSLAVSPRFFDEAEHAHDALIDMFDQIAAGQQVLPNARQVLALRTLLEEGLAPDAMGHVGAGGQQIDALDAVTRRLQVQAAAASLTDSQDTLDETPRQALEPAWPADDEDTELLDIFLEEGFDILDSSAASLARWRAAPQNLLESENLLRDLHTLKGGARMVEIAPIGDLVHELEFVHEKISAGTLSASEPLFTLLQSAHDQLAAMLDAVRGRRLLPAAFELIEQIRRFPDSLTRSTAAAQVASPASERATGDMVKVAAELLEGLGNLADETSLLQERIEQQVDDAQATLHEMETTIERIRDQLRRLDTQTQGQILSREQGSVQPSGYEEFDPLEMDRHSQLQQLSRALFESASDLLDLKDSLVGHNHQVQRLLKVQGRANTELQAGLMRTRMVPFERMLPRLQRVVRQVAGELGKQVELEIGNAQGEMDRSVLERMIAPLEHMLRNAVDHGLETPAQRQALGKRALGTIRLDLLHAGRDIVIQLSDDGAGVPLPAVRAKAVKLGLLDPASDISDHDVLQFILQPGFSTAAKITQISGRGLGMDVVHEEVKQLGGSMTIDSRAGQGACFTIRLPFTVSVNRALMLQCGEEQYAVALNTIEALVRVMPEELTACYSRTPPRYEYAGQSYELRYLGQLLANQAPRLLGETQALPVLLVRAHDHQVAVQVDAVAGSREIVVKGLGPQFAAVPGLAGATILGDGKVVLILDLLAQLRAAQARQASLPLPVSLPKASVARPLLVMVVDDSITVRKFTGRLLERHGMQVLTAKDGVDAMALLEEHRPDVLLLDIEMPRMDGFEVAIQVRRDPRLRDLPIIMITSRTGQKHRDRAQAIGVNDYLGKPFQDHLLLDSIARWSGEHAPVIRT